MRLVRVSSRVTVAYGPVSGERWEANATIVVGERSTAVIDAMMTPEQTVPIRAEAERLAGGRPVRLLVLTHADPDHVLGHATFDGAVVVGSARSANVLHDPAVRETYAGIVARAGHPDGFSLPEVDVAFDSRATVDLGGVTLEGSSIGPGHSASDTLWWCPEERIAWSGDLVFNGAFPLVRTNLENWFAGLDRMAGWAARVVIPGHGPVGGPEVLSDQRRLLETLATEVGEQVSAGATIDDAVARVRLEAYRHLPLAGERVALAVRGVATALGARL